MVAIFSACQVETLEESVDHPTDEEKDSSNNKEKEKTKRTHGDGDAIIAEDEGGVGAGDLAGRHGGGRVPLT